MAQKSHLPADLRRALVERDPPQLTIARQCELLDLPRSTFYYQPLPRHDSHDLLLMKRRDQIDTEAPFYGSRRMVAQLRREGHEVNRKHIQRLMRAMGLEAIYCRPKTSQSHPEHRKFPYLLLGLTIDRPNQVWSMDMTYLPMKDGFLYLSAVIDWSSRYVLSWELSNSLETSFCLEALEGALRLGKPLIFNTDQGVQFTSEKFSSMALDGGMKFSMDGRGRAFDNIFTERLWRTVKDEEVDPKDYLDGLDAHRRLGGDFDNERRLHQALKSRTPREVPFEGAYFRPASGTNPSAAGITQWKIAMTYAEDDYTAAADLDLFAYDTCPSGGGTATLGNDLSYDNRSRITLNGGVAGKCLEYAISAVTLPAGQTRKV